MVTKEGRPDLATEAMGLFEGDMYVILKPREEWTTAQDREGLVAAFDSALAHVPGLWVSFTQPLAMRLDEAESGIRTDLGIKVVGPDLEENQRYAERIRGVVASVPGAADVGGGDQRGDGADPHGGGPGRARALRPLGGRRCATRSTSPWASRTATELVDGPRRVDVAVRLPGGLAQRPGGAGRASCFARRAGSWSRWARWWRSPPATGPELIGHEDAQRRTLVLSNVRGRDLGSFVEEVQRRASPPRWSCRRGCSWSGAGSTRTSSARWSGWSWWCRWRSCSSSSSSSPPSAPCGRRCWCSPTCPSPWSAAIAMLWLRGLNLSLSASIGFIALFGIAVLNGVVLVTHLNEVRARRQSAREAVRAGAADRLRPVLMTALVASLGFVPMALSTSPGSEVQRPLASVVIGGLITSTFLTLFVLPALYLALARWQARRAAEEDDDLDLDLDLEGATLA